jgi:hypothetical protein
VLFAEDPLQGPWIVVVDDADPAGLAQAGKKASKASTPGCIVVTTRQNVAELDDVERQTARISDLRTGGTALSQSG